MNRVILVSLKYHPGLLKEMLVLLDLFRSEVRIDLIMSEGYEASLKELEIPASFITNGVGNRGMVFDCFILPKVLKRLNDVLSVKKNDKGILFLYNPHPLNLFVAIFIRLFKSNIDVWIAAHEPFRPLSDLRKFGLNGFMYYRIVQLIQTLSFMFCDRLVVFSSYGKSMVAKNLPLLTHKTLEARLLMRHKPRGITTQKLISYVGTASIGKGIDDFVALVNFSLKNRGPLRFVLISSSDIQQYIEKLDDRYQEVLEIINKPYIQDKEIEDVIRRSAITVALHKVATQSGVMSLSYSYGVPVLHRDLDAFTEFKTDDKLVLSRNFDSREFYDKCVDFCSDENLQKKVNLRVEELFKNNFDLNNFKRYYNQILNNT